MYLEKVNLVAAIRALSCLVILFSKKKSVFLPKGHFHPAKGNFVVAKKAISRTKRVFFPVSATEFVKKLSSFRLWRN